MDDNEKKLIRQIKKAIFEVIQTRAFRNAVAPVNARESKKSGKKKLAVAASLISIVGICVGWHETMNELKAHDIQARIDLKREWQQNILSAMNGVRLARIVSRINCTYDKSTPKEMKNQQLLRSNARFVLVKEVTGSESVYGKQINDLLLAQTKGLIDFDEKITDVCHTGPEITDDLWLTYVKNADALIISSINPDIKQLEAITNDYF